MISEAEKAAWSAVDVVSAEEAAYYLASGEPLLRRAIERQMARDYTHAVTRLLDDIRPHLEPETVPDTPFGLLRQPEPIADTAIHQLRSVAFEEAEDLSREGKPDQVLAWIVSRGAEFERQEFRRGEVDAWAVHRGLLGGGEERASQPLNPKERAALYRVIGLLAAALGLDLSRPSASATRLLEVAAREGIGVVIARRTLEKHFRAAQNEIDRSPSAPDEED